MAEELQIAAYDYDLPPELIAQVPCIPRDQARLMRLERAGPGLDHHRVRDLPGLLRAGDLLVFNDSRVLPARLLGQRAATGGKWEGLYLRTHASGAWELLSQTRGWLRVGEELTVPALAAGMPPLRLRVQGRTPERHLLALPVADRAEAANAVDAPALLERYGQTPPPPYIRGGRAAPDDRERYQTIFAREPGSAAAPTAGLHFTPQLVADLEARGVQRATVTLHVGTGTFAPLRPDQLAEGLLHEEWCQVPVGTVAAIEATRAQGGRVIAVGTTSARTLESAAQQGWPAAWSGATRLFIRPPFRFQLVDGLLTNFHLPRSSLLMLVAAFACPERLQSAYAVAIRERYRFYSYGDAMLIL
ncbi:MAG TPA: tRNA preQ1(34) S-adenosylmethionine ribosyltransferase-isomerase QueA [Gemmatales bacterium]|nr:tRNA preQ1(34) S-adenosylmethionine ribosyltransferase-isomerase QueA [Gemmatales bacterium]